MGLPPGQHAAQHPLWAEPPAKGSGVYLSKCLDDSLAFLSASVKLPTISDPNATLQPVRGRNSLFKGLWL